MFYLLHYTEGDTLDKVTSSVKLSEVLETAKTRNSNITKFEIFTRVWKASHLCGLIRPNKTIDWMRVKG